MTQPPQSETPNTAPESVIVTPAEPVVVVTEVVKKVPSHGSEFRTGAFLGFLIGAGVAVWYAPRSGKAARQSLTRWTRRQAEEVKDRVQGESIAQSLEAGRQIAHQNRAAQAESANPVLPPSTGGKRSPG